MDQLKAENARLRALVDALQAGGPLWESAMKLDEDRATVLSGSTSRLQEMVASGSDIRVVTQFRHNEHVDAASANAELVLEPSSFPITVALYPDAGPQRSPSWVAMVMTARQPVNPNDNTGVGGFNQAPDAASPAAALSLFLYNQNAQQGRAAVQLSREAFAAASSGVHAPHGSEFQPGDEYPKRAGIYDKDGNEMMEIQSENDLGTNAPSSNFIYRFQGYEFFAQTRWETALHTGVSCKAHRSSDPGHVS